MEVTLALLLPPGLQRRRPGWVGRRVGAHVHRRRGALEHEELLGIPAEMWHQLDAGSPRADECHPLVGQLVQAAAGIPAGVVVIPARGMERVTASVQVLLDTGDTGQLGLVVRAVRHHHEPRADVVTAVGGQPPALDLLVPAHVLDLGGEDRAVVEVEVFSHGLAVREDLGAVGELLARQEAELLEHRDVAVGVVVALDARKAVPVPHAAEVPGHVDDPNILHAGLFQVCARQQSGEPAPEDGHLDVLIDRGAVGHRGVRVYLVEVGQVTVEFEVLRAAVLAEAFLALPGVLGPHRVCVDVLRYVGGPAGVRPPIKLGHLSQSSCGSPAPMYFDNW